jgi:TorA maturation chaperone TorD
MGPAMGPAYFAELLRALGALCAIAPPASGHISAALGTAPMAPAEHTRLFVLDLPPYASVYLSSDGRIGGEVAEAAAGMWRVLGLSPPAEPDHLSALLALYAELCHAGATCRTALARQRLRHASAALRAEHLDPWLGMYLYGASTYPGAKPWVELCRAALNAGPRPTGEPVLASSLRSAPTVLQPDADLGQVLDSLVTPARCGLLLTHRDLEVAGEEIGLGVRRSERRLALRSMLEQDAEATFVWLAGHARAWSAAHLQNPIDPLCASWWSRRAAEAASALGTLAARAARRRLCA